MSCFQNRLITFLLENCLKPVFAPQSDPKSKLDIELGKVDGANRRLFDDMMENTNQLGLFDEMHDIWLK